MTTKITDGVQVSVESFFQPEHSSAVHHHYVFSYKIRIHNHGQSAIQLMRRHWYIFDSNGIVREVEGEGVIGLQPIIESGEFHEYISGCNFRTEIGKMKGTYTMKRLFDDYNFHVVIPQFVMIAPYKLN
ncbi:MAG: Co2+/Mg2+ efflux protein ApaG [Cytophagales bacterium]|nr:MAG: Co2+/Mg2+ efflux protein ApaG [Cytophagales bacterium]